MQPKEFGGGGGTTTVVVVVVMVVVGRCLKSFCSSSVRNLQGERL